MESERFDRLAKVVGAVSSRRTALRGLARGAVGGALGMAGVAGLSGGDVALAKKCNGNAQCDQPKNPCKRAVCKNKKCRKQNERNGKSCGDGKVCLNGRCVADCDSGGATCPANDACCSGVCTCGTGETAGLCQEDFFQGFEDNTDGWTDGIERVASGTDGISARTGGFFAKVAQNGGSFTRWGGYANIFPGEGYATETAIYIDIENAPDVDTRFDYSSAVSQPTCAHRRDFVFNGGVNLVNAEPTFCVSASNDGNGWPCNPDRDPVTLEVSGWYVFRHEFNNESGILSVNLILLGPDGSEVGTWTLSDASDIIGDTVGGNRYGWFVRNQFEFLAIDDTSRTA